jgi:hypothetical protein
MSNLVKVCVRQALSSIRISHLFGSADSIDERREGAHRREEDRPDFGC